MPATDWQLSPALESHLVITTNEPTKSVDWHGSTCSILTSKPRKVGRLPFQSATILVGTTQTPSWKMPTFHTAGL